MLHLTQGSHRPLVRGYDNVETEKIMRIKHSVSVMLTLTPSLAISVTLEHNRNIL